jgi:hypothetical protein
MQPIMLPAWLWSISVATTAAELEMAPVDIFIE